MVGQLGGGFLGNVVAAVDGLPADVVGPIAPYGERVAVQVLQVVLGGPQEQQRAADPAPGRLVGVVVLTVDAQSRAVVLDHGMNGARVVDRAPVVLVGFLAHVLGRGGVPRI